MRDLLVSYSPELGGAERLLLDLAAGLEAPGLACPPGALMDAALAAGLETEPLRPRRLELRGSAADRAAAPLRLAAQARELRAVLRRRRPGCVVGWSMRGLLVATGALAGSRERPALVFQHNDFLPGPVIAAGVRAATRRADAVSCVSRAVAAELDPRGALGARLRVIAPGVDLERFELAPPPPAGEPPQALLLGALVAWKRPELALEAVALAARKLPELRLTVAGAPLGDNGERLLARLRERAERDDLRGRVSFLGALDDPRPALARASCLLHCADREPFGLVLVEALASGRPVAAPAAGGPLDIVDESCGRLYPPGDAAAAARALKEVLAAPGLGPAARRRAEQAFSLERARREFRELLEAARAARGA